MHIALDRRQKNLPLRLPAPGGLFLCFHKGQEIGYRLLHDASAFDHLRQKHLPCAEKIADNVHACHQRPLDDLKRFAVLLPGLFHVCFDVLDNALDQRVREPFLDRSPAPSMLLSSDLVLLSDRLGKRDQPLGGVRPSIQQHILHQLEKVFGNLLVHGQLPGVDDPHVQTGLDGVVQKGRVHCLTYDVVPTE